MTDVRSAYYESLHETPLIANTIARKKLFEMNRVISDTAEYGCYLYVATVAAVPLPSPPLPSLIYVVIVLFYWGVNSKTLKYVRRKHLIEYPLSRLRSTLSVLR